VRLRIVALGHRMPAWVSEGVTDYARRLPRDVAFELVELKPAPRDRGRTVAQMLAEEARRIESACAGARIVALDERGASWSTRKLADALAAWRNDAADVAFVVGSADGLDPSIRERASAVVSLSAMTLPHALVRVMLAEQIYRGFTLLAGHPYHRE
jgi:23S rRNA (pseudouridine1915-N3)-methyltransferase